MSKSVAADPSFPPTPNRLPILHHAQDGIRAEDNKIRPRRRKTRPIRRRTWMWPFVIVSSVLAIYTFNPTESNPARRFLFLSYALPHDSTDPNARVEYGKGLWDVVFVGFYVVVLTFTRDFCMQELLAPLARAGGIKSRAKRTRFAEQMYTALYIAVLGPWGLQIMGNTSVWLFDTHGMYENFPHRTLTAGFKSYYLVQAAFWAQQVVVMVLGLEERRKDFQELVAHHVVTVALIGLSYRFHFTHIGLAVYIAHDISDLFLALSKSLNYLQSWFQKPTFALCIAVWVYLRHYICLRILYSMRPGGEFGTVGPYQLDWEAEQYKSPLANVITFGLLALLQALNLFWLYCLLRNAFRLVFKGVAKDDRSENEESDPKLDTAVGRKEGKDGGVGMLPGEEQRDLKNIPDSKF